MSLSQYLIPEGNLPKSISPSLFRKYSRIASDPEIHSGWPHIRGTRVLISDVFKTWIQFNKLDSMIKEYKTIGVDVSHSDLDQALKFMIAWMNKDLDENTRNKISR